jgi:undecaprenyl-diphosphatase
MIIDNAIFNLISVTLKNNVFDFVMPILSDAKFWRVPLLVIVIAAIAFGKKKGLETVLVCLVSIGITDFMCGGVLQPLIGRHRPLGGITMSFPSCHAANLFAAAFVIYRSVQKTWLTVTVYTIAALVAYSRIYTTSHYPSDVLGGMILGSIFAYLVVYIYASISQKIKDKKHKAAGL